MLFTGEIYYVVEVPEESRLVIQHILNCYGNVSIVPDLFADVPDTNNENVGQATLWERFVYN
jgi:hypothetical protein